jgi:hypothetical protein
MVIRKSSSEEPRAGARGFFYRKSHLFLGANRPQSHMAIHPRSGERGSLAFSRDPQSFRAKALTVAGWL